MKQLIVTAALALAFLCTSAHADTITVGWGSQPAIPHEEIRSATQISGGRYHSVALLSDGTTVAWGDTANGKCTPMTQAALATYLNRAGVAATRVLKVYAGDEHTVFWLDNKMVVTIGKSSSVGTFPFTWNSLSYTIVDVACGQGFTAVVHRDDMSLQYFITAWGTVPGIGTGTFSVEPGNMNSSNPPWSHNNAISQIVGGPSHMAWINATTGKVTGLGWSLGLPQNSNTNNSGAVEIVCGNQSTFWRTAIGDVFGVGDNMAFFQPISIHAVQMSAGVAHLLTLSNTGLVSATTLYGLAGPQSTVPVLPTTADARPTQVSAGWTHSMALLPRRDPPTLKITPGSAAGTLNLRWPTKYPEYTQVAYTGALDGAVPFTGFTATRTVVGSEYQVVVSPPAGSVAGFYRLNFPGY